MIHFETVCIYSLLFSNSPEISKENHTFHQQCQGFCCADQVRKLKHKPRHTKTHQDLPDTKEWGRSFPTANSTAERRKFSSASSSALKP
jgi:hypothetical protein